MICVSTVLACTGPKSLTKKRDKLSRAGIHQDAVNYYIKALKKKNTYLKAQIGLKNSSEQLLNKYKSEFFTAYQGKDNKTAVYQYVEMQNFVECVNHYNARLSIPNQYKEDFENAKDEYLNTRFQEANQLMAKDLFFDALLIFEEIEVLEPNFKGKDFKLLKEMSRLEPHYRNGNTAFNNNHFREAYYEFKSVHEVNSNYKDISFKLEEALAQAQFNIGILKFRNYSPDFEVAELISSEISNQIISSNNPFIKLIDRSHLDLLKEEQLMNLKGISKGKAAELIGADAFLSAKVLSCTENVVYPIPTNTNAYESFTVKKFDEINKRYYYETQYRKVRYKEYYGYNEVYISFEFQLISAETGEILSSEIINKQLKSEVNYATYNGNFYQLVPGIWMSEYCDSPQDRVYNNAPAKNDLHRKFNGNKNAISTSVLKAEAQEYIAREAAKKIIRFNPENI